MHVHVDLVSTAGTRPRQLPSHFPVEAQSGVTHAASRLGEQMEFMASSRGDERTIFSSVTVLLDVRCRPKMQLEPSAVMQIVTCLLFKH